jgi:hypothetical protein
VSINPGGSRGNRQRAEPTQKDPRGQRLADPAQGQRAERHAKLDCRKKVVEILLQLSDGAGSGHAGSQHLLDTRIADRDQGELGGHKEAVSQNQHGHGDELKQRKTVHLACENSIRHSRRESTIVAQHGAKRNAGNMGQ